MPNGPVTGGAGYNSGLIPTVARARPNPSASVTPSALASGTPTAIRSPEEASQSVNSRPGTLVMPTAEGEPANATPLGEKNRYAFGEVVPHDPKNPALRSATHPNAYFLKITNITRPQVAITCSATVHLLNCGNQNGGGLQGRCNRVGSISFNGIELGDYATRPIQHEQITNGQIVSIESRVAPGSLRCSPVTAQAQRNESTPGLLGSPASLPPRYGTPEAGGARE